MNEFQYTSTAWLVWIQLRNAGCCMFTGALSGALAGILSIVLLCSLAPELSAPWSDIWYWVVYTPFSMLIYSLFLYLLISYFPQFITEDTLVEGELRRRYRRYMRYRNG